MLSVTLTPLLLSLGSVGLQIQYLSDQKRSFVWLGGCIVTAPLDTKHNESTEEIIYDPWVSNQWGYSTFRSMGGCSSSAATHTDPSVITPSALASLMKEIFKCQWVVVVFFFFLLSNWFSVMCSSCELGCNRPTSVIWLRFSISFPSLPFHWCNC